MLRDSGEEIVEFKEKTASKGLKMDINIKFLNRVKTMDKINFARNLGLMLEAGLALSRAMSVLERQSSRKAFKTIISDLMANISLGMTFSEALAKHPKVFPQIFVAMVNAGEQSGTLAESLKSIAVQMESSYALERRVRGAMVYPGIILSVMVGIAVLMLIFVVPTLSKVFKDLNVPLPLTTRIVIGVSDAFQHEGILVILGIALVVGAFWWWFKRPAGRRFLHASMLKIPVIGVLVHEVNAARTARTLSSLLKAGVNVVESVTITASVVQNVYFRKVLVEAEEAIKKGELMSKVFAENEKLYPAFFAEMLSVGEETGKIGDMLWNVANYYEDDVDQKTKNMSTIIEPILMVMIGAGVGFFAVSMISPMYSLVNVIN